MDNDKRREENGIQSRKAAQEARDERERRRRRAIARQKRRRKRRIQRAMLIGAMVLILLILIMLVRAVAKGISGKSEEKKAKAVSTEVENEKKVEEKTAVITTAGDIIMHKPFLESSVYKKGDDEYDYNDIFKYMKDIYEKADFSVATTEYALTGSDYSGYPMFCAPDAIAEALAENGLDMCLLANNHIYDGGDDGLQRTMDTLEKNNLLYTGVRKTENDKKYVVKEINGIKVGFFNYVFETGSSDSDDKLINGIEISDESKDLINSFHEEDPDSLYEEVEEIQKAMKKDGVEYTIAYMHWGVEYKTEENANQDKIAQKLCDMGIDALIASHPHVIEPVDLLESEDGKHQMVCAYAIGNHLSNQRTEYMEGLTDGYSEDGMVVTLTIHRDSEGKISLEKADFIPTWVYHTQDPDDTYYILPLNNPDKLEKETGLDDISEDVEESLKRTNSIVEDGVEKVQKALPIKK